MGKYKRHIFFILICLFLPLLISEAYRSYVGKENIHPEKYSVILYQYSENSWLSLMEGVTQAQQDLGIELNLVTMATGAGAEEQMELIDREIKNGTRGILLAAVDSEAMRKKVQEVAGEIPIVTVETGVGEEIPHIGADDYEMGYLLGKKILRDYHSGLRYRITVIQEFMERESVKLRFQGLLDAFKKAERPVDIIRWARGEGDYDMVLYLEKMMLEKQQNVVVGLDKFTTESLIEAYKLIQDARNSGQAQAKEKRELFYGIGNTEKVVDALDDGILEALVYQNEFSAGYEGVEKLKEITEDKEVKSRSFIEHHIVERGSLYELPHERLLFPIV